MSKHLLECCLSRNEDEVSREDDCRGLAARFFDLFLSGKQSASDRPSTETETETEHEIPSEIREFQRLLCLNESTAPGIASTSFPLQAMLSALIYQINTILPFDINLPFHIELLESKA
jgi:hypothetical protein